MSSVASLDERPLHVANEQEWCEVERRLPTPASRFFWLDWLNQVLALSLLIPGLPAIAILAIITRLTSRGPALYRQSRVGLRGTTFILFKIRTMTQNAEANTGPIWSPGVSDPRVTAFGRFLRKTHLDELPQLFNVLMGEMTLIGPRPERPEFTQFLAQEIPGYVGRLSVKPGITGLAQINLPPDTDLESVRKKLEVDLAYISNSTLWTDARILLCTALKVIGLPGYSVAGALGLFHACEPQPTTSRSTWHPSQGRANGHTANRERRLSVAIDDREPPNGHVLRLDRERKYKENHVADISEGDLSVGESGDEVSADRSSSPLSAS